MKKYALAMIATVMMAAGAHAADEAQATMVFEGYVSSVLPSSSLVITGIGGGALDKGALTVDQNGKVSTSKPVIFEVRRYDAANTAAPVGEIVQVFDGRIVNASMVAGNASVDNALGSIRINATGNYLPGSAGSDTERQFSVSGRDQSSVEYFYARETSQTGLDIGSVAAGTAIQASVVVVVSEPGAPA